MTIRLTRPLALCASLTLSACLTAPDAGGEAPPDDTAPTGETASAVVLGGWSTPSYAGMTYRGAQVGLLNGLTYVVAVGTCGSVLCGSGYDAHDLRWSSYNADRSWAAGGDVLDASGGLQGADSKVSLAAFNGYLYMLHTGAGSSSDTYLSKFDPATQRWTQRKIGITSYGGPPALAAYNGRLYLVGITSGYAMWYATMDTAENFTPTITLAGHTSASRVSLAVGFGKLWITHRAGTTHNVVYSTFDGATWSAAAYIYGGVDNGILQSDEPVIGFDGNLIRLVHQRPGSGYLWQSSFDGCQWATTESSIGTSSSSLPPSLAPSGVGLAMITEDVNTTLLGPGYYAKLTTFTRPAIDLSCFGPFTSF